MYDEKLHFTKINFCEVENAFRENLFSRISNFPNFCKNFISRSYKNLRKLVPFKWYTFLYN